MSSMIKIILGTVITSVIPVLIIEMAKKKKWMELNDFFHRNIIYYMTMFCVLLAGNLYGNTEFVFTIIIGSSILHILGVCGVKFVLEREEKNTVTWNHGMYYAFSCIVFLFLGADYLMFGNRSSASWFSTENMISRTDGMVLLFLLLFYLFIQAYFSKKSIEQKESDEISYLPENTQSIKKSIIVFVIIFLLIYTGVALLFSGFSYITWKLHQSFYLVNSLLGVWVLNLPYIYLTMKNGNKKEVILEESYIQGLVGLTGGIGCTAIIHPFWMSARYIQDVMILCVIVTLMQLIKKIPATIRGSIMIPAYLAVVIGLFVR